MSLLSISYTQSGVSPQAAQAILDTVPPIFQASSVSPIIRYLSHRDFINLPFDADNLASVQELATRVRALNPRAFFLLGIGGSNLGAVAIIQALKGKLYNQCDPDIEFYCADTVDSDMLWDLVRIFEAHCERGHEIIINVVSKSGTTIETAANLHLFLGLLKRYKGPLYYNYVVITTDQGSPLWYLAQQHKFPCLTIPAVVGGRFSVLSAVGLFPLAVLGIDINALCEGARTINSFLTTHDLETNHALNSAIILAHHYAQGLVIHNTFFFSLDFELLGGWYRQLVAESLGKSNKQGMRIGIVPLISLASIDLHSVGQLYFGGPHTIVTTFVSVARPSSDLEIDGLGDVSEYMPQVQQKTCAQIMRAILLGTQSAYKLSALPYIAIELPEKNAYYMGQLLQLYMMQVVYLAHILDVNPFDQPAVELYKQETRKMLIHE